MFIKTQAKMWLKALELLFDIATCIISIFDVASGAQCSREHTDWNQMPR
jgi:hypothetical protein